MITRSGLTPTAPLTASLLGVEPSGLYPYNHTFLNVGFECACPSTPRVIVEIMS
jgi:hypothetical protein